MPVTRLFPAAPVNSGTTLSLVEKYRPRKITDFIGLEKAKRVLERYAEKPIDAAWLFVGPSGSGKSAMALALATEIAAEVHVVSGA